MIITTTTAKKEQNFISLYNSEGNKPLKLSGCCWLMPFYCNLKGKTAIMMKSKLLEKGQKFNHLTIIKLDHIKDRKYKTFTYHIEYYLVQCDCGNQKVLSKNVIKNGLVKSCGCIIHSKEYREKTSKRMKIHGYSNTRLYKLWIGIKTRCNGNQNREGYNNYGGRGITICNEWKDDFLAFREWALNNGYDENAKKGECTIDRIDVNGNYEPNNCRFVNIQKQCNNRRNTTFITYQGQTKSMADWCRIYGIRVNTAHKRILLGWNLDRVFNEKTHEKYARTNKRKKKGQ